MRLVRQGISQLRSSRAANESETRAAPENFLAVLETKASEKKPRRVERFGETRGADSKYFYIQLNSETKRRELRLASRLDDAN